LDKIEDGDSKRKVIRIHFGHPMKKNEFVGAHGELTGEGKEGVGEEEEGAQVWGAMGRGGLQEGGSVRAALHVLLLPRLSSTFCT
jgi:hypothetical protein